MLITQCSKNNFCVSLELFIDHNKKEMGFDVIFSEYGKHYKRYRFATLKAAYNKFDALLLKYDLLEV